jgi:hypothetical protein
MEEMPRTRAYPREFQSENAASQNSEIEHTSLQFLWLRAMGRQQIRGIAMPADVDVTAEDWRNYFARGNRPDRSAKGSAGFTLDIIVLIVQRSARITANYITDSRYERS